MPLNRRPKRKSIEQLEAECIVWNHKHPIGTRVIYHPIIGEKPGRERVTRTSAQVLSGHTAVVWLEGESGCVCLEACEVIQ
jgi:hypothetical protein